MCLHCRYQVKIIPYTIQAEAAAHARAGGASSHNEAERMARYATT